MSEQRGTLVLTAFASTFLLSGLETAEGATRVVAARELNIVTPPKPVGRFNFGKTSIIPIRIRVVVLCAIAADGKLNHCRVVREQPRGWRAGGYAIRMAETMKVSTTLKDGSNSAGVLARVPFVIH